MLLVLSGPTALAHNPEHAGILFLHFGQKEGPYAHALRNAFMEEVRNRVQAPLDFYVDGVDALESVPGHNKEHDLALVQVLRHRYSRANIHVVVPVSNEAIEFVREYGKEICPEASVVYMIMSFGKPPSRPPLLDATGVIVLFDAKATLDLALRQNPRARHVIVIAGTAGYENMEIAAAHDEFLKYGDSLDFQYITDVTYPELLARAANIPRDSVVLMFSFSRDAAGDEFIGAHVLPTVSSKAPAPVYVVYGSAVGYGAVGGIVHDFSEIGRAMGAETVQVLSGTRAGDIPVQESTFHRPMFDWKQMERWGISRKQLPPGAFILNEHVTLWDRYKWWLVSGIVLLVLQTGLISGYAALRIRERLVRGQLSDRVELENLVANLAASLSEFPDDVLSEKVRRQLERLLTLHDLDRVTLYSFDETTRIFHTRFVGKHSGVRNSPSEISAESISWAADKVLSSNTCLIGCVDDLPPEAHKTRDFLHDAGVRALAAFPLQGGAGIAGAISFSSLTSPVEWTDKKLADLQTVADIFNNAFERKHAEMVLRASQELNATVLDSLSSHLAVIDRHGTIIAINKGWRDFWRANSPQGTVPPGLGVNYLDICRRSVQQSKDGDKALAGILAVLEGKVSSFEMEYECSGPTEQRWFSMHVSPLLHSTGAVIRHLDTTSRRKAEQQIRESEARFRQIADSAPVMIWMTGPDRGVTFISKIWVEFTGADLDTQYGLGWTDYVHPDDIARVQKQFEECCQARRPFTTAYRLRRRDGQYRWMLVNGVPRILADGSYAGYIGGCIDVTEQKEAEEARTHLSGLLINAQEQERARIARELHDHINQRLALLAIDLQQFQQASPELPAAQKDNLEQLWELTNAIAHDVQTLSHQLHSSQLQHLGLIAALRGLCHEVSKTGTISVEFSSEGSPLKIDDNVSLALFRVAQEGVRNIGKYSQAESATLNLTWSDHEVSLTVRDDGIGFDPEHATSGLGLISMRERMRLVEGDLVINSAPGNGTRLTARVRFAKRAADPGSKNIVKAERRRRARA